LDNHINRLKNDHEKAQEIGGMMDSLSQIKRVEPIETNIVIFELHGHVDEANFINKLSSHDIHIISMGSGKLRMVTHLNYTDSMHDKLLGLVSQM